MTKNNLQISFLAHPIFQGFKKPIAIQLWSIALFSFFFLIAVYPDGLSLSHDSCIYLSVADSFNYDLKPFINGETYTLWPPLNPIFYAILGNQESTILIGNFFCIALTIFLWNRLFFQSVKDAFYRILFAFSLSSSTALLLCAKFVWSETLFILLFSAYIYAFIQFYERASIQNLLLVSFVGFLFPLQRIAGIYVFIAVALFGLTDIHFIKTNFKKLGIHIVISLAGFAFWFYFTRAGLAIREEGALSFDFLNEVLHTTDIVISRNFLPMELGFYTLLLVIPLFFAMKNNRRNRLLGITWMVYTFLYILTVWQKKAGADVQEIDRFLAPAVPCLFFIIFDLLSRVKKNTYTVKVILFIWLLYPLARNLNNAINFGKLDTHTGIITTQCDFFEK